MEGVALVSGIFGVRRILEVQKEDFFFDAKGGDVNFDFGLGGSLINVS